jgi:hypothetical protein
LDLRYNSAKWTLYGDDGGVASGHVAWFSPARKSQQQPGMGAHGERGNPTQATRSHKFSFKVKAMAKDSPHFNTLHKTRNPKLAQPVLFLLPTLLW